MQLRKPVFTLSALVLLAGCSIFNREGPSATCVDLGNGATNACSNGIIATCASGTVTYRVCDAENACEQGWQTEGQYRCDQSSQLPSATGTGGSGGQATGEAGGSILTGGGTGDQGSGTGGASNVTGTGGSGGETGCGSGPCAVGSTGQSSVDALAIDGLNIYFSDCTTVWSVPKTGGFATVLSSQLTGCSYGQMVVDGQFVYVQEHNDGLSRVVRIPTAGGSRTVIVDKSVDTIGSMAVSSSNVFWFESLQQQIVRTNADTAVTDLVASAVIDVGPRMLLAAGHLVWCAYSAFSRVSTMGTFPASPSSVAFGRNCNDLAVGTDGTAAYTDSTDKVVGLVTSTGQMGSDPVSGQSGLYAVAIDATNVYYSAHGTQIEIRKAPKAGGSSTQLAVRLFDVTRLLVDDTSLYWFEGSNVMRILK